MPSTIDAVMSIPTLERALQLADMSPTFLKSCIDEQDRKIKACAKLIAKAQEERSALIQLVRDLVAQTPIAVADAKAFLETLTKECPQCDGKGMIDNPEWADDDGTDFWLDCPTCHRVGRVADQPEGSR